MERRKLGKTGLEVSVLGFGGSEIGFAGTSSSDASRMLNSALDLGLNLIDTAAGYLASEQLIGNAIGKRRGEFCLVSKCGQIEGFSRTDWSKDGIVRTVEQSLANLQTDHLDVLLLHSCSAKEMESGEALAGIEAARARGYTRFIGYSGDSQDALWAIRCGEFDVLETSVSIADQESIDLLVPEAATRKMGVIAKRPIANAAWRYDQKPKGYEAEYWRRLGKLQYDFLEDEEKAGETALRFTLSVPGVTAAIVGTTKPERIARNADIAQKGALLPAAYEAVRNRWREVATSGWVGQV